MIAIEKTVEYGGADPMTRRLRSNLLMVTEQYQRALADLNWLLEADPDDDAVLACAMAAGAECIISGDRHLMALKEHGGVRILTPRQALTMLQGAS